MDLTLVCQTTLGVSEDKLDTGNTYLLANVASAKLSESVAVGSSTIRGGAGMIMMAVIRMRDLLRTMKGVLGRIGAILHLGLHLGHFHRQRTVRSRRLRSVMDCFRKRCGPIRMFGFTRNCLCWHYGFPRTWG